MQSVNDVNGIFLVDKEKNMTSHDVVWYIRKRFEIKKVGHAGTLDPNATGLLVMLIGKATKMSNQFLEDDKEYIGILKLGERTDTGDSEGTVIDSRNITVQNDEISEVIKKFVGEIEQVPPMYSAKKVNGKKLYNLARRGLDVKREPVIVNIKEIEIKEISLPTVEIRVICSKGTYIRQLAEDIGEKLGCGAYLKELRRISSGKFNVENAVNFSILKQGEENLFYENIIRI